MTFLFYFLIGLLLVLVQTTLFSHLSVFSGFYDLLIPFVLYIALFRPAKEAVISVILFGFIMDDLSGGPFGMFGTTYLWLFIGSNWIITFMHARNRILLSIAVVSGVLIQNLLIFGITVLLMGEKDLSNDIGATALQQVFWAICTGPFFIMGLFSFHQWWEKWQKRLFPGENENGGSI